METSFVLNILYNIALLLVLSILYDYSWIRQKARVTVFRHLQTGILIGGIGIILMLTPWTLSPGMFFDTRSMLLSLSGLFFGAAPTVIAMAMTTITRILIGGDGTVMGVAVIITSGSIGIAWRLWRSRWIDRYPFLELLALGLVVHLFMLACTVFLPQEQIRDTLEAIVLPTLIIYPTGTILLGSFMLRMYRNSQTRKSREFLVDTEHKLADLLENVNMLTVMMDKHGEVLYSNRYLQEITGYTREELIGKNWIEVFISNDNRENVRNVMSGVMSGDEAKLRFENNIICKDGSEITVLWNNTVLRSEEGEIIGGASIGDNVTLKRIAEEQLREAKSKAEESDRLKTIFLGNLSHEIRTPMNAILGFTNILATDTTNEEERTKYLEIIQNSGKRLLHILESVLDLSKIEAQQFTLRTEKCNLYDLLHETYETFRSGPELSRRDEVTMRIHVNEQLRDHMVSTDRYRLRQVLDNLVSNAIKYTRQGEIILGCDSLPVDDKITIYVKDTGIGIADHIGDLVFERFRQVEENEYHEGAGLGLSISKAIVEQLGGRIWYTSVRWEGSTFFVEISNQKTITS